MLAQVFAPSRPDSFLGISSNYSLFGLEGSPGISLNYIDPSSCPIPKDPYNPMIMINDLSNSLTSKLEISLEIRIDSQFYKPTLGILQLFKVVLPVVKWERQIRFICSSPTCQNNSSYFSCNRPWLRFLNRSEIAFGECPKRRSLTC